MEKISLISLLFIFTSCSNRYDVPSSILQKQEMGDILWDMVQAQNLALQLRMKDSTVDVSGTALELTNEVYRLHKISKAEFDKSYGWYMSRPDLLRVVIDSVYVQRTRENTGRIQMRYDKRKQDSIRAKFLKNAKSL